jgi:hypothetical protein
MTKLEKRVKVAAVVTPFVAFLAALERVGLARNVVRIAPDRQHQREGQAGPVRAGVRA